MRNVWVWVVDEFLVVLKIEFPDGVDQQSLEHIDYFLGGLGLFGNENGDPISLNCAILYHVVVDSISKSDRAR